MARAALILAVACLAEWGTAASLADPPTASPTALPLSTVLRNLGLAAHRSEVETTALQSFRVRNPDCAAPRIVKALPPKAIPQQPLTFDAVGNIVSGLVVEPMVVEGCGKAGQENILTGANAGQRKTVAGLPGTTKADLVLARDTKPYLAMYVGTKGPKDCKDDRIMDTRFDDFDGPPNPKAKSQNDAGRPYHETWTVLACGVTLEIPVHYIPDETGTLIQVSIPPGQSKP